MKQLNSSSPYFLFGSGLSILKKMKRNEHEGVTFDGKMITTSTYTLKSDSPGSSSTLTFFLTTFESLLVF